MLPKTQREDIETNRFEYAILIAATSYFITLKLFKKDCDKQKGKAKHKTANVHLRFNCFV